MDVYLCGYPATIARWGSSSLYAPPPKRPDDVSELTKADKKKFIEAINVKDLVAFHSLEPALDWATKHTYETPFSLPAHSCGRDLYQMDFKPILQARVEYDEGVRRIVRISAIHLAGVMGSIPVAEGEIAVKSQRKLGPFTFTSGVIGRSLPQAKKKKGSYSRLR